MRVNLRSEEIDVLSLPFANALIVHARDLITSGPDPCAWPLGSETVARLLFLSCNCEKMILGPRISMTKSDPSLYDAARKPCVNS